jgi:glycosyltransferase involved in cell wall biosynthesis
MSNKRILFLSGYFPYKQGGAEYQAFLLAEELQSSYDICFAYRKPKNIDVKENKKKFQTETFSSVKIKYLPTLSFLESRSLLKIIKKYSPDIIYVRGLSAHLGIAAWYAKNNRKGKCKLVWHIAHDRDVEPKIYGGLTKFLPNFLDKKIAEFGIKFSSHIIGQTHYQDKILYKNYSRSCDLVVRNWHPIPKKRKKETKVIRVLWIANIKPIKRHYLFLELSEVLKKINNVEFIIIGRDDRKELEENINNNVKKYNNVRYLGELSQNEVNEQLNLSHILVNTSISEGFSNTFIQAWMRSVPVVSLNTSPDDIIITEKIGYLSLTIDQLILDVGKLISNHKLREEIGCRSRKYAINNHSMNNTKGIIENIFNK